MCRNIEPRWLHAERDFSLAEKHNVLLIDRTQLALWPLHIL